MKRDSMKCFGCGHGTDVKPDEPFILLTETPKMRTVRDECDQFVKNVEYQLYACPKCHTVRMKDVSPSSH